MLRLQKVNCEYFGTSKLLLMHTLLELYNSSPANTFQGYECYPKEELIAPFASLLYVLTVRLRGEDQKVKTRIYPDCVKC